MLIPNSQVFTGARRLAAHGVSSVSEEVGFVSVPDLHEMAVAVTIHLRKSVSAGYRGLAWTFDGLHGRPLGDVIPFIGCRPGCCTYADRKKTDHYDNPDQFHCSYLFFYLLKPRCLKWRLKRPVSVCAAETREKGGYQKLTQQESQIRNTNTVHN
jgi:hypothetical protein